VPGDEDALLGVAAEILTHPLPRGRPLWSATFVSGLTHNSQRMGTTTLSPSTCGSPSSTRTCLLKRAAV